MSKLQQRALGRVALSKETVESFYDGSRSGTAEQCLKALCESHERLRAELEGADLLLDEVDPEILRLQERIRLALALTDTGSPEFMEAFNPRPDKYISGWRIVEKIREVLLGETK